MSLPRSLFGRTLLALAAGLALAQLGSAAIHLFDRGSSVYRLASLQIAARIGQTARILDRLPPAERHKVVEEISGRHLRVSLPSGRSRWRTAFPSDRYERQFSESLQKQIGAVAGARRHQPEAEVARLRRRRRGRRPVRALDGAPLLFPDARAVLDRGAGRAAGRHRGAVRRQRAAGAMSRFESLAPILLLLLLVCFGLAAFLVRMTTRSLDRLARAADAIGQDPASAPLREAGPSEVRRVIAAFNRMQERVRRYLVERGRLLGAISHDLKTPITRLRLRAEMLPDPNARQDAARPRRDADHGRRDAEFFPASARTPSASRGRRRADRERLRGPARGRPSADRARRAARSVPRRSAGLRRCLDNLIENAIRYGGSADIEIADSPKHLTIAIRDRGPGIPDPSLSGCSSLSTGSMIRATWKAGAPARRGIARNIARWHGGDVTLRNASASSPNWRCRARLCA